MAVIGQSRPLPPTAAKGSPNMRTPLFIFGVALALVAFLVMFAFGIVFVGRSQPTGTVPVVVAKTGIDARTPITADMLTLSSIPASAVPPNSFLHIADVSGKAAVVDIYKGEPISANLVATNDDLINASQPSSYLPIPEGYVGVALPASELQTVAGYVAVGDYIDVMAELSTSVFLQNPSRPVAKTVFSDLKVIRVGAQSFAQRPSQVQGVTGSITVVMTQCDANYMYWLLINATLKYTLISAQDYSKASSPQSPSLCPGGPLASIRPEQIDQRWHFTNG